MSLANISLDDKYERESGPVYLTGNQALLRLVMNRLKRDQTAGHDTAAYITGYRGSPMHNVDKELWRAERYLEEGRIKFQPAVNEDLAATACWGTQQAALSPQARHDGVFALWYGKGPGLDRSIDAIRHAHLAGTSSYGGVLVAVGDDPAMKSTDVPAASETMFSDLFMPTLYPATVQEMMDYGLLGWELSRFSGAWVGFKLSADTIDTAAVVECDPHRLKIHLPDFDLPEDGLSIRAGDRWLLQEPRMRGYKLPAALAFARANNLNQRIIDGPARRFGIISAGKAALDTREALRELGLDDKAAAEIGVSFLKVGMTFPFDGETVREFADGLEEVLVVEEKRPFLEMQTRDTLYDLPEGRRPRVTGRTDEAGAVQFPECGEFGPPEVARVLSRRMARFYSSDRVNERMAFLEAKSARMAERSSLPITRVPYFCSGCPHNSSTKVPEGSTAQGGVGCHYMVTYMNRDTDVYSHMGGEGANWIGQAPFTDTPHVFQNIGDGTYYHSGLMAIRACVAAGVNITYKVLFNDAVAMTGGQPHDGPLTPMAISQQVRAEGVERIDVVSDQPEKYPSNAGFAKGTRIRHRCDLDTVQRELRETPGVSVLVYDQTCAAEKRRRRKRGEMVDPPVRMFIHPRVCEGCGDCSVTSNCLSVLPLETPFGRKRVIDQSSCNKDYTCADGTCPSFVRVVGATPRKAGLDATASGGSASGDSASETSLPREIALLPEPKPPTLNEGESYDILVAGIGGTGVVTIAALLTMGAHLENKVFSTIDQFGMAQKGGAVTSHVRIATRQEDLGAVRLSSGAASLVLGCDHLVTAGDLALDVIDPGKTRLVVNTHQAITGQFALNPDTDFPSRSLQDQIEEEAGPGMIDAFDASRLATALLGDSIAGNVLMLGYAYQKGLVPVSAEALQRAITLNGLALEMNLSAFEWGRRAAHNLEAVEGLIAGTTPDDETSGETLEDAIQRHVQDLTAYQNAAYARRYEHLVGQVAAAETERAPGRTGLAAAVAFGLHKLMAYKDEYEVARLYSDPTWRERLNRQFDGVGRLEVMLAPPLFVRPDPLTGRVRKRAYGPWIFPFLTLLAKGKTLRGTALDLFGYTEERRAERALIEEYESIIQEMLSGLDHDNHALAIAIAEVARTLRGFGQIKADNIEAARTQWQDLLHHWRTNTPLAKAAD